MPYPNNRYLFGFKYLMKNEKLRHVLYQITYLPLAELCNELNVMVGNMCSREKIFIEHDLWLIWFINQRALYNHQSS